MDEHMGFTRQITFWIKFLPLLKSHPYAIPTTDKMIKSAISVCAEE